MFTSSFETAPRTRMVAVLLRDRCPWVFWIARYGALVCGTRSAPTLEIVESLKISISFPTSTCPSMGSCAPLPWARSHACTRSGRQSTSQSIRFQSDNGAFINYRKPNSISYILLFNCTTNPCLNLHSHSHLFSIISSWGNWDHTAWEGSILLIYL